MSHMDMAEMPMSDMSGMPGMPGHAPASGDESTPPVSHTDCSIPGSPGACQTMTTCAPGVMTVEQPGLLHVWPVTPDAPVWRSAQLRSIARAPEPPPPRA